MPEQDLLADFEMLQGYCFPDPAWRMYFWAGKGSRVSPQLYAALEKHDAYLWRTRDSNGDGLLENWCVWDTGEDHSSRLITRNAPTRWPFDFAARRRRMPDPQDPANFKNYWFEHHLEKLPPPTREQVMVPFASMDVMAYSYEGRATLAKIARELGQRTRGLLAEAGRGRPAAAHQRFVGPGTRRLLRPRPHRQAPGRTRPQQSPLHVVWRLHPGNGRCVHPAASAQSGGVLDAGAAGLHRRERSAVSKRAGSTTGAASRRASPFSGPFGRSKTTGTTPRCPSSGRSSSRSSSATAAPSPSSSIPSRALHPAISRTATAR